MGRNFGRHHTLSWIDRSIHSWIVIRSELSYQATTCLYWACTHFRYSRSVRYPVNSLPDVIIRDTTQIGTTRYGKEGCGPVRSGPVRPWWKKSQKACGPSLDERLWTQARIWLGDAYQVRQRSGWDTRYTIYSISRVHAYQRIGLCSCVRIWGLWRNFHRDNGRMLSIFLPNYRFLQR